MTVVCYPQPGKAKSRDILSAFATGCGGRLKEGAIILEPGTEAAFFGVVGIEHLLRLAAAEARVWWYGDNAFFDVARGRYFRFARRSLQIPRPGKPDFDRLKKLGIEVAPWRKSGDHILVVEQSEFFFSLAGVRKNWLARVCAEIRKHTKREIRVRRWTRDKAKAAAGFRSDLAGAHALVTHSSAAANEALIAGVPVFVGTPWCPAATMATGQLSDLENPRRPDGREEWAAGLASMQWTLDEIREGIAWRKLNE